MWMEDYDLSSRVKGKRIVKYYNAHHAFSLMGNSSGAHYQKAVLVTAYTEGRPVFMAVNPIYQKDKNDKELFLSKRAAAHFTDMMGDAAKEGYSH